jgi:hypothetical protein
MAAALPYRKPSNAGTSRDRCGAHENDNRNTLYIHSLVKLQVHSILAIPVLWEYTQALYFKQTRLYY